MLTILVDTIIKNALTEDIGTGDITTLSTVPDAAEISGRFIAKEDGVLCGIDVARRVFETVDSTTRMHVFSADGSKVHRTDVIAEIHGKARSVLQGERVALNLLQRMSGIATQTSKCVEMIRGTKATIVDTRKTTPGLRELEKYSVRVGGGSNHRHNLADGILIKDNHIAAAGGITAAVTAARRNAPHTLKIEVEVENMEMVQEALACGADIIMLDNMTNDEMKQAVALIDGRAITEASGNMGERDLRSVADTGVDLISIGALTHSVRALDISLRFADPAVK